MAKADRACSMCGMEAVFCRSWGRTEKGHNHEKFDKGHNLINSLQKSLKR